MADHTTYGLVCSELSDDLSKTNLGELKLDSFDFNSVKISIKAASLNFPDLLMTQGKYQNRPELPFALGMEGSGIVEKIGSEVKNFDVGNKIAYASMPIGAYSQQRIIPAKIAVKIPIGISCLLYTSPSPRDATLSRMPSSA